VKELPSHLNHIAHAIAADRERAANALKLGQNTSLQAYHAVKALRGFIGPSQLRAIGDGCRGEERQFFYDKVCELSAIVDRMPKTGETDGMGDKATVWLHYFAGGSANYWITEKDTGAPGDEPEQFQSQAFGLANCFGGPDDGELGYISIPEILANGGELDLYFKPQTLAELKAGVTT
jgi:hypothetical protein